ncbi:MAG TPA: DNA polymerase III subunit delta [Gemmatimonadales bacterium]|nr:DNA polymerase III subunit delta [Gemmatimonadales bacterium]
MGALTLDALHRSLKQPGTAPDPVYYLHGDEDVLKDEAVRALLDRALEPGTRDFNFDRRSAADLDPESFHSLVNTPPMLAARRAVVIRGLEELRKTSKVRQELVRYLGSPSPTTLLILVQGAGEAPDAELARAATTVAAQPLPPERVRKWVAHRAGQLGLALEPDAAELLVTAVGNDLGALGRELDKLAALAAGRPATRDDVAALVGVRRGETLEDLVDAALERRAAAAAQLVQPVLEQGGMTGVRMLTALGTALLGTALARAELDRGAPRGRLEVILLGHLRATRPYGLGSWDQTAACWAGWAEWWTAPGLRRALRLALDADRALKSTTVTDERGILAQLVLSFGVLEQEAA